MFVNLQYSQHNMIENIHFHLDLVHNLCYYETCIGLALFGEEKRDLRAFRSPPWMNTVILRQPLPISKEGAI
jgi:hypothetical protein